MRHERSRLVTVVAVAGALVLAAAGCSQFRSGAEPTDVSMAELADRVSQLEQQVGDLQLALAEPTDTDGTEALGNEAGGEAVGMEPSPDATGADPMADGTWANVVGTPFLNIRQEPNVNSTKIGALKEGALVEVLGVQGEWTKIHVKNDRYDITGWVASEYLANQ